MSKQKVLLSYRILALHLNRIANIEIKPAKNTQLFSTRLCPKESESVKWLKQQLALASLYHPKYCSSVVVKA